MRQPASRGEKHAPLERRHEEGMNSSHIDQLLALAARQHGVVSVNQGESLGISPEELQWAVDRGWLRRERRGVVAVSGAPRDSLTPLMATLLAGGPRTVVSHSSSAVVHRFEGVVAPMVELITPLPIRVRMAGVRSHTSTTLIRSDVWEIEGLRVTSPIRTLIDLAPRFEPQLLGEILDEGTIARLWTPERVGARLAQLRNGAPVSSLAKLLELRMGEGHLASRLEQRVCRVLRPVAGPFEVHHTEVLDGIPIEMDLAWCEDKVDGEVDGLAVRAASRTKFARQVRRENVLAKHGWRIVHFTYEMDDATIIAQVAPLLSRPAR